jgi:hypothetical protein
MSLELWNKFKTPPQDALKKIVGGRLSGKSDISPIWRYQVMTEAFGPCGIGWKFQVVRTWTEDAPDEQRFCFVELNLYIKYQGEWSEPIPGFGGDTVLVKEKSGLHLNDEAYKMALTDALGSAMKMLGVAADVYANKMDTKYGRGTDASGQEQKPNTGQSNGQPKELATDGQISMILQKAKEHHLTNEDLRTLSKWKFRVDSSKQLTTKQAGLLIAKMPDLWDEYAQAQQSA